MQNFVYAVIGSMALNQVVQAADTSKAPYAINPASMDRNVECSKGDCVIQDDGDGRPVHKHPQHTTKSASAAPATAPTASQNAADRGGR